MGKRVWQSFQIDPERLEHMNCLQGSRRRLLFLFMFFLITAAMFVTGCGEEEKYNKEKAQILDELKQVQLIKIPEGLEGKALDAAIDELAHKHKAGLEQIDNRLKELGEKYGKADAKFKSETEELRKTLKQDHVEWMKAAVAPKIKGDAVMGVGIGCRWKEIAVILGEPIEKKQTAGLTEFKYSGLVFNEIRDHGETNGKPLPPSYGPDAYYMTGNGYKTASGIQIGMTKAEVLECYKGKLASLDDRTDPKFIIMRYDPTPDHKHEYNQFMQLTDGKLTRLIVAKH
jgi:hypothetical protein